MNKIGHSHTDYITIDIRELHLGLPATFWEHWQQDPHSGKYLISLNC